MFYPVHLGTSFIIFVTKISPFEYINSLDKGGKEHDENMIH